VQREVKNSLPLIALLAPDEDLAVVTCGSEDIAIFWVGPGDAPYCSFMTVYFALAKNPSCEAYDVPL
jgi:hypothetical protein